jgi:(1->4)-alpha-D-glucan 1-alpha-D-glucosylmutase
MRDWRAVYRLQLTPELGLAQARALVPYLDRLGISHLYLSPVMEARRGSQHGYDQTDPARVREELGGEAALRELAEAGLGILLDVVPNHMAVSDENPYWRDETLRRKFFDVDPETGWQRRFFTIDELAGVRQEDPDVFEATHAKALQLVDEGVVDGLRIDHPDGLADPRGYLRRLRGGGVEHVWVEKILEPGEELRDWPVEGTVGYEFANDVTALFVNAEAADVFGEIYAELAGETRSFARVAYECKLEVACHDFRPEFAKLRSLYDHPALEEAAAGMHVYRTYVEPWSGRVDEEDRRAVAHVPDDLRRVLLLEERSPELDEFVVRWQQTTGAVMAKGVEDTAFYRYHRLVALNEVGGNPGRFGLAVEDFHRANLRRAERFPRNLLASMTHDTKRSGDVRARIVALTWIPDEWRAAVLRFRELTGGGLEDPNEDYLLWQTLVGSWPIEPERLEAYMQKALREAGVNTNWIDPDTEHERRVQSFCRALYDDAELLEALEPLLARVAADGRWIALASELLRLTCPGVPDVYQGDELEDLALVDPDNRRPIDWEERRVALGDPPPKLRTILAALDLRRRRPESFAGPYDPLEAGSGVCAFRRGDVVVSVPVRPGAFKFVPDTDDLVDLLPELAVGLYEPSAILTS